MIQEGNQVVVCSLASDFMGVEVDGARSFKTMTIDMHTEEKQARLKWDRMALLINLGSAALAFVWVPITLTIMVVMPFAFVVSELLANKTEEE